MTEHKKSDPQAPCYSESQPMLTPNKAHATPAKNAGEDIGMGEHRVPAQPAASAPCVVDAPSEEYKLLVRIADANVIFPSLCANNNDAYSINDALAKYKTKRISERNSE